MFQIRITSQPPLGVSDLDHFLSIFALNHHWTLRFEARTTLPLRWIQL